MRPAPATLRARLLRVLLILVALALFVQALISYRLTLDQSDDIFDHQLQQVGELLARGGSAASLAGMGTNSNSLEALDELDISVQVYDEVGRLRYASNPEIGPTYPSGSGFSDAQVDGKRLRVFATQSQGNRILVLQEIDARREVARELALGTLWPMLIFGFIVIVAVAVLTTWALRPLSRLQRELSSRSADSLQPLSITGLPGEVAPLVAETNRLMDRMAQAYARQRAFVADAAHELRTPLAALQLQNELVRRAASDEERDNALARQQEGLMRAQRLVEQLLSLARQEGDVQPLRPIDLVEVAAESVRLSLPVATKKGLRLTLGGDHEAQLLGQRPLIASLVENLLQNAIHHTPPGGTIEVSVAAHGSTLRLSVFDSGPGIPPSERERVLDRFYRVPGAAGFGSGLGLAIANAAVMSHGGRLILGEASLGGLSVVAEFPIQLQAAAERGI